jgi:hypothetical protein
MNGFKYIAPHILEVYIKTMGLPSNRSRLKTRVIPIKDQENSQIETIANK